MCKCDVFTMFLVWWYYILKKISLMRSVRFSQVIEIKNTTISIFVQDVFYHLRGQEREIAII